MATEKTNQNLNVAAKSGQTWKFFGKLIGGVILLVILVSLIYRGYNYFHKQKHDEVLLAVTQPQSVPQRRLAIQQVVILRAGIKSEAYDIPQGWTHGFELVREGSCMIVYPNQGAGVPYCRRVPTDFGQSVKSLEFLSPTSDERLQLNICPPEDRMPCLAENL